MNPYTAGIRFNDYLFSEPGRLVEFTAPKCAGICAILVRDSNWAPKPLQPLCFLEFGNNSDLGRLRRLPNTEALLVSVLAMPFSTTEQRLAVRRQLVSAYNPVWDAGSGSSVQSELVYQLHELERKHEEQTTQLRLLQASLGRLFDPQAEPKRRPIGFLPAAHTNRKLADTRA